MFIIIVYNLAILCRIRNLGDVMKYKNIVKGIFKSRPNRFIAHVEINGKAEVCHVKNTGRCKELLTYDAVVYLEKSNNPQRKTKYDLIAVEKGSRLINMDSQIPNKTFVQWLEKGALFEKITLIKPETMYRNSRFDFYIEADNKKVFAEVKGVTLEEDNIVKFPDAPTLRGLKHIKELCYAVKDGYEAYIVFIVQMNNVKYFTPNYKTHREFGEALKNADKCGVHLLALECDITPCSITAVKEIPVVL